MHPNSKRAYTDWDCPSPEVSNPVAAQYSMELQPHFEDRKTSLKARCLASLLEQQHNYTVVEIDLFLIELGIFSL